MRLRSISIAGLTLFLFQLLILPVSSKAAPVLVQSGKIRPYAGIGILLLAPLRESAADSPSSPVLYEEPSVFRIGTFDAAKVPPYEWIFGSGNYAARLIVTSRKGGWLRVVYDEAGREAWLKPPRRAKFLTWDSFLKGQTISLLAGLQKRYYQTVPQPGFAASGTLAGRKPFKVIKVENDWAMAMPDKETLTWLRWKDEDGRLLIALENPFESSI